MHFDAAVFGQPVAHRLLFVGGVVVGDQVQLPIRIGAAQVFEECQELLVAMPRFALPGDLAGGDL
jgi:hypothetical protein